MFRTLRLFLCLMLKGQCTSRTGRSEFWCCDWQRHWPLKV